MHPPREFLQRGAAARSSVPRRLKLTKKHLAIKSGSGTVSSNRLPTLTSAPWSASTKRIVAIAILVLGVLVAREISGAIWTSLLLSVVVAYLLSPIVRFAEQRIVVAGGTGFRRTISVLVTWIIVIGVLTLFFVLIIPATVAQLRDFADQLPRLAQSAEADLERWLNRPITVGSYTIVPWEELQSLVMPAEGGDGETQNVTETLRSALLAVADSGIGVVGSAVVLLTNSVLAMVMVFYLMRDGPLFALRIVNGVPESYRGDVERLLIELGMIWNAYLRGQLLLGFAVGVATYIVTLILGLPQPLVLGLLAGFLEFIPNIGPTLSSIPAILFALITPSATIPGLDAGLLFALVVVLAYVLIQQLEALFLVPRILGSSLDLHPFVVLVAIMIGANLVGVLGVILAAPTVATLRLFLRYVRGKLLDEDVFPMTLQPTTRRRGIIYALIRYFLNRRFRALDGEIETVRSRRSPAESDAVPSSR